MWCHCTLHGKGDREDTFRTVKEREVIKIMANTNLKNLTLLLVSIIVGIALACASICKEANSVEQKTQTQIIKDIPPKEAFTLIQNNKDNPNFVILDVRTPKEFADEHIENAINLDYYSETFKEDLNKLDKNKIYLIYCRIGNRSGKTLNIMKESKFSEVYNMLGGITGLKEEGLPTTK